MYHRSNLSADHHPTAAQFASRGEAALSRLAGVPELDAAIAQALDTAFGAGRWFLFWDEDLTGRPIRGTISLAFGKETLVVA